MVNYLQCDVITRTTETCHTLYILQFINQQHYDHMQEINLTKWWTLTKDFLWSVSWQKHLIVNNNYILFRCTHANFFLFVLPSEKMVKEWTDFKYINHFITNPENKFVHGFVEMALMTNMKKCKQHELCHSQHYNITLVQFHTASSSSIS